jgi:creatine kinase
LSLSFPPQIKAIFQRFADATSTIEKILKDNGTQFSHSEHLGYILACPSNLGILKISGTVISIYY